jgi:hypothetical protein
VHRIFFLLELCCNGPQDEEQLLLFAFMYTQEFRENLLRNSQVETKLVQASKGAEPFYIDSPRELQEGKCSLMVSHLESFALLDSAVSL